MIVKFAPLATMLRRACRKSTLVRCGLTCGTACALSVASLEEDLFTLMQPRAYATLQGAADAAVEAAVDAIVGALFSVGACRRCR